jgi:hypothetical protein
MSDFTAQEVERFKKRLAAEQQSANVAALTHGPAPVTPETPRGPTMMINDPTRGMRPANAFERFMMGTGAGAENVLTNIGEMTGVVPTDVATQRLEANRPFTQSTAGKVGEFVGETGALAPVTGAAGRLVSGGGQFFGYGGPVVRGATEGGLAGAVTAGPGERKTGAAFGAGTALAVPGAGGAYRGLTRGIEATDAARNLGQRGVTLTPGQINPESNWSLLEESMLALPVIGPRVTKARQQAWRETQGAIAQEAAPPGIKITPKDDVRQTMVDLENAYTQAYDVAKGFPKIQLSVVRTQGGNEPLRTALVVPQTKAVKASSRNYVNKFLNEEMERLVAQAKKNNGYVSSDELLGFRSRIREKVRNLRSSPDANLFEADDLLEGAEQKVTQALESQLPPDVSAALRAIDAQYVNKKVLENAVYRASNRPEGFTPEQFALEVRAATGSKGKFARGGGPMRDISMEASEVFPPRQPMTGRQLPGQVAGIAAGAVSYPFYGESQASKLARQLLLGGAKPQQAIQEFERKFKRKLSPAEREAMATVLRTSAGVYGEEERPLPFATTAPF